MDWNDVVKIVGQFALSHRGEFGKGLSMVWGKLHGASGDEPLVTPSGHVLTASEAILVSMYAHVTNVLAKRLNQSQGGNYILERWQRHGRCKHQCVGSGL